AGLLGATLANGDYLIAGRNVTDSPAEEEFAHRADAVPFSLQARLEERGAVTPSRPSLRAARREDGRLVTGQNPASARPVAEAVVKQLG
ncbi:type 1 glutamine amidotransferase domain-containing protein, partial [Rhodococcus hoagii]|nr:type 1 glutamine amidotransferase domain-containing protein [Prescottella equi]